eukprot:scaffold303_cov410-Prasinococcus_capsulatus_cf.AAC.14
MDFALSVCDPRARAAYGLTHPVQLVPVQTTANTGHVNSDLVRAPREWLAQSDTTAVLFQFTVLERGMLVVCSSVAG